MKAAPRDMKAGGRQEEPTTVYEALQPLDARDGVILIDTNDQILHVNACAFSLFPGQAKQLINGLSFIGFIQAAIDSSTFLCSASQSPAELSSVLSALGTQPVDIPLAHGKWLRMSSSPTASGRWAIVYTDITTLRHREDDLVLANAGLEAALETQHWREIQIEQAHTRLDAALGNMSQGLCMFDADQHVVLANRRFAEIFAISYDRIYPGMPLSRVVSASIRAGNHNEGSEPPDAPSLADTIIGSPDGTPAQARVGKCVISISRSPMPDGGCVTTYEDITERRRAEDQITYMAHHDALTGLANRILFAKRLEQALFRKDPKRLPAVLCLDLDRFKSVNDTFGHATGDLLLKEVSRRIQACVRESDTVARFGGDEFVVLLPRTGSTEAVEATTMRIVASLAEEYVLDGVKLTSGTSIGVAFAHPDHDTREGMLNRADVALYAAKAAGRGQYRMFERGMDAALLERQQLEHDVLHALERGELYLMFQPLLDTATLAVAGFEALLRWNHPIRGNVPVSMLIQTAEETGAIMAIGAWVIKQACAEAAQWPNSIWLSVNVSPIQFRSADLTATILDALSASGLSPSRLEVEITESILLKNEPRTIAALQVLRQNGIRVSIDDFGVGHASLKYLLDFPLDRIKIDQVFTKKLLVDPKAVSIMTAIVDLGRSLGVRTTIEGIETQAQFDMACVQASSELQGYLFSQPVRAADIPATLERLKAEASGSTARHDYVI